MPRNPNPRKRKRKQKQNQRELPSSSWEGTKVREPYPDHPHPTPEQCRSARDALLQLHGFPKEFASYQKQRKRKRKNSKNGRHDDLDDDDDDEESEAVADNSSSSVLDGLISTLLSQNTTDANSTKAFQSLKSTFPSWQQVLDADPKSLENAIRCGGLAATKAARIKSILKAVSDKRGGQLCLEYLHGLPVDEVKAELSQFKGIGPKTGFGCKKMKRACTRVYSKSTKRIVEVIENSPSKF